MSDLRKGTATCKDPLLKSISQRNVPRRLAHVKIRLPWGWCLYGMACRR